jgi:alcohol dehydrogenase
VLGHEFVGIVEAVGDNTGTKLKGKRVVGSPIIACGTCNLCQGGLSEHCRDRSIIGIAGRDGCFADRFTMPVSNLVPVPDSLDDDHAVFAVPLGSAIQAARQFTIEGKPYITVLGDGPLGLLMVQVMAKLNASVRLIGRYTEKLSICEKWGVKHRHVDDIGRRADQDIVVDCTGSRSGLELSMKLVRPRGRIVLKSIFARRARSRICRLTFRRWSCTKSASSAADSAPFSEAVHMLASGSVDVVSLISSPHESQRRRGSNNGIRATGRDQGADGRIIRITTHFRA